jgi:hypothetical protein
VRTPESINQEIDEFFKEERYDDVLEILSDLFAVADELEDRSVAQSPDFFLKVAYSMMAIGDKENTETAYEIYDAFVDTSEPGFQGIVKAQAYYGRAMLNFRNGYTIDSYIDLGVALDTLALEADSMKKKKFEELLRERQGFVRKNIYKSGPGENLPLRHPEMDLDADERF